MRCLYCGNELALLKKLTGGGEFCSEAHRQKYQEEYNRLALSRLLQAHPPADRPSPEPLRQIEPEPVAPPPPVVFRSDPDPEPREPAAVAGDSANPPEPGFLISPFEPVLAPGEIFSGEPFLAPVAAFLPNSGETRLEAGLSGTAPIGMSHLRDVFTNSAPRPLDRQPDPREFARPSPVVSIPVELPVVRGPLTADKMFAVSLDLSGCSATIWTSAGAAYAFQPSFAANCAVMTQPLCEELGRMPSTALLDFDQETASASTGVSAPLVPAFDLASPVEFRPVMSPAPAPEADDDEPAATSSAPVSPIFPETSAEPAQAVAPPSAPLLRFLSIDETDPGPVLTNGAAPNDIIVNLSVLEAWEGPAGTVELGEHQEPTPETGVRVPGLADKLIPVDLKLAASSAAAAFEQPLATAQPDFRITAPSLDAVAVRPKVYFASRPKPAAQATHPEAPAPAAPEPAKSDTAAPPTVSRKRDKRASKATKSPEPPSPAPPPQPRIASTLDLDELRLNLEQSQITSPLSAAWSRMGLSQRIAIGLGLVIALSIGGFFLNSSFASKPSASANPAARVEPIGPGLVAGAGGWASDWTGSGPKGRQISLFRPSIQLADYRIEFQGQIESKSIGWVFRAVDPRNYYASRLEMVKSGLEPTVVLVHYAMVDGRESLRRESPVPFKVKLDTVYKVRTDIFGNQFRTYLQEQLADEWSDDRLKKGGFGLMTDPGDRAQIRLVQLHELRAGK